MPLNPFKPPVNVPERGLGKGVEMAITLVVFVGIGWLLDRWLGVFPVFTIALLLLASIGQFVITWYDYDARMKVLEAERVAASQARPSDAHRESAA